MALGQWGDSLPASLRSTSLKKWLALQKETESKKQQTSMLFLRRQIDARSLIAALGPDSPAEPILKCNVIPSSLSFPPPWLFFAVFKGMLLLSARCPAFSTLLRSTSLLTAPSLCSASQITSPFLTRITSTSRARVPPCCGLPGHPPASLLPWPASGTTLPSAVSLLFTQR